MTVLVPKTVTNRLPAIKEQRARRTDTDYSAHLVKKAVVSLIEIACLAASMAFLLSLAIVMPALTHQVGTWLASGQWNAAPLIGILERIGFAPHGGGAVANWFLSCDIGFLMLAAASTFAFAVWISDSLRGSLSGSAAPRRPRTRFGSFGPEARIKANSSSRVAALHSPPGACAPANPASAISNTDPDLM